MAQACATAQTTEHGAPPGLQCAGCCPILRPMKIGSEVMGRYVLEAHIASGGMGSVFKAQERNGEPVAIKVLRRDASSQAERFKREAQLLMELEHPGIVRCLDAGVTEEGEHFLVLEWLEGEDLARRLDDGPLSLDETLSLVGRVAQTLGHAHDQGIVHRDVKPSNIFLPGERVGRAKLLDFGIAHWLAGGRLTGTGMQLGTPSYMSPEQIQGAKTVGPEADIFALGCVMYECLSGEQAFAGNDPLAVFYAIMSRELPRIEQIVSGLPEPIAELVRRMMSRKPTERPADGTAVADAIARMQAEHAGLTVELLSASRRGLQGGITALEQQLVCVVAVKEAPVFDVQQTMQQPRAGAAVSTKDDVRFQAKALWGRYESLGARIDYLMNGSLIVVLDTGTVVADCAEVAARCALELQAIMPEQAIAVATGRALVDDRKVLGDVVERAIKLLGDGRETRIQLDQVTSRLIANRFRIDESSGTCFLTGERREDRQSMLLGQPTPFMGRIREMAALEASLLECVEERFARIVMLTGAPGVGKSRVKREFLRRVEALDLEVSLWTAAGRPMASSSPMQMLAQAIRQVADIREDESLSTRQYKLSRRVAASVPEDKRSRVTAFLGELIKTSFSDLDDVQLRAARRDPRLMGAQIRQAVLDFLDAETDQHPVLFVLEGLQWADHASVTLLDRALRRLVNKPLLIFALSRTSLSREFQGMFSKHDVMELSLRRLPERIARKMVRTALVQLAALPGGAPLATDDALIADILQRADGNPLYLEELIRGLAAGRRELPTTVLAMVHARLQNLPFKARRVLRAASLFGDVFWLRGLTAVLADDTDLEMEMRVLVDRELVSASRTSQFAGEQEYRIRHDLIREAAYGMLTQEDRQLGHRLAGAWLERAGETDPLVLAEHFRRGGDHQHAVVWFARAADNAYETGDLEAASDIAQQAASLGASGELLGRLRAIQARGHQWQGQLDQAVQSGQEAMELLSPGHRSWYEAAEDLVATYSKQNNQQALQSFAQRLIGGRPEGHDQNGWLIVGARLTWMLFLAGEVAAACTLLDAMESEMATVDDLEPSVSARVHGSQALRAMIADENPAGCLRELRTAIRHYQEAGDRHNTCDQQGNAGFAEIQLGLYQAAEVTLRAAVATADELGIDELLDSAKHNLSAVLLHLGKLDEARDLADSCTQSYERRGNPRLAASSRVYLASILLARAEPDAAESQARIACDSCPPNFAIAAMAHAMLARILLANGQASDALPLAEQAFEAMRDLGAEEGESLIRLVHAEVLQANGRTEQAQAAIATARERLLERAGNIDDREWRQSYLNIPEHVRTLELHQAWAEPT